MGALTISFLICLNAAWCSGPQLKGTLSLGQFSNGFCKFQQFCPEFWKIINHIDERLYLLLTCKWWHFRYCWYLVLGWLVALSGIGFPKEIYFCLLIVQLVIMRWILFFLAVSNTLVSTMSWSLWFCCFPTIMMSSAIMIMLSIFPKYWSSFLWNTSPATVMPNGIMVYWYLPNSILKIVR